MAGISLPLRSLLGSRSFLAQAAGYAYSALAMAGPWLLTSFHMLLLGSLDLPGVTLVDLQAFQSVVLYSYAGSMVLTGLLQLPAARHLSDRLFVKDRGAVVPTFTGTAILSLVLWLVLGIDTHSASFCREWRGRTAPTPSPCVCSMSRPFWLSFSVASGQPNVATLPSGRAVIRWV